jgi:hypothetical protein
MSSGDFVDRGEGVGVHAVEPSQRIARGSVGPSPLNSDTVEYQVKADGDYARKVVRLLEMIEKGRHEGLTCPKCAYVGLTVSYTRSGEERYGIWLECPECGNIEHADRQGRPAGFEEGLIDHRFQKLDDEAWSQADRLVTDVDENVADSRQEDQDERGISGS